MTVLAGWIALYKQQRRLLHSGGRCAAWTRRSDAIWVHGVVAADRSAAVMAYVQLDEVGHDPLAFRVPGLDPARRYRVRVIEPAAAPSRVAITPDGPSDPWRGDGLVLSGAVLASVGLPAPRRWAVTALLVEVTAV